MLFSYNIKIDFRNHVNNWPNSVPLNFQAFALILKAYPLGQSDHRFYHHVGLNQSCNHN